MYAVIKTGGKQYKVTQGETLKVEKIDAAAGAKLDLTEVLMVGEGDKIQVGAPFLNGGKVTVTVVSHGRGKKVGIVKFRRRKHYRKEMGHRQSYTELQIDSISAG